MPREAVPLDDPWAEPDDQIVEALRVDPLHGLSTHEAARRLAEWGPNLLRQRQQRKAWRILVEQLMSFIVGLLAVGAGLSLAFGELPEFLAILVVIVINTLIGFLTELRAVRSMEALQRLGSVEATVRRDDQLSRVAAQDLVPGDIVILEGGDIITADLRVLEASRLQANESTLTGESVPVAKGVAVVERAAALAERPNMLYKGTAITRGAAEAVVVATGMNTELGRITALVDRSEEGDTPLEKRLDSLGKTLAAASLVFVALVGLVGWLSGKELYFMIETAIALAVASVPEGLPIVATIALARGMWIMARNNALIAQLPAVETLGSTNVILTDKTGTLTENQMTMSRIVLDSGSVEITGTGLSRAGEFRRVGARIEPSTEPLLARLITAAALCTDAALSGSEGQRQGVGDPLEVALLVAAEKAGLEPSHLEAQNPELREEAFDPTLKLMATYHRTSAGILVAVKGATEAVLAACERFATTDGDRPLDAEQRATWHRRADELGGSGLRVLAIADKRVDSEVEPAYEALTLLGLVALLDPPREYVREAIEGCHRAGIRVVMVTGDHPSTALNIGKAVGVVSADQSDQPVALGEHIADASDDSRRRLLESQVVARTSPEQKLDLISLYQQAGNVVAMVGDGVNDAPALRSADIGIAMGRRGTQVAREAAAMVLQDDEFRTITLAIEQGRVIFSNIRKFVTYLVSCNLSEILTVGLATLVNAPLPILPLQILYLNLITDVFPALALGVGKGDPAIMSKPPREVAEGVLTRAQWFRIVGYSVLLAACVLSGFALAWFWLGARQEVAVTISFLILAMSQLFHVFNMAERESGVLRNEVSANPWVWAALALCAVLLLLGLYLPGLADVLGTVPLQAREWGLVLGLSALPMIVGRSLRAIAGTPRTDSAVTARERPRSSHS